MAWTKTYHGAEPMRVNKWLAQEGACSRREAETLIGDGHVEIDGVKLTSLGHKIADGETLTLNADATKRLDNQISVIFHKPKGIVSGTPEDDQVPAIRMITRENLRGRTHAIPGRNNSLAPLGRLDMDSRGLLIMSEDGVLAKAIIGPESRLEKEYLVRVAGEITDEVIGKLRHGLELDGRQLRPAIVEKVNRDQLRFILREGRNRQIRRMCELVELRVFDLFRVRVGPVRLEGLEEGKWRIMVEKERSALLRGLNPSERSVPRRKPGIAPRNPAPAPRSNTDDTARTEGPQHGFRDPMKPLKRTKLKPRKRTPIK